MILSNLAKIDLIPGLSRETLPETHLGRIHRRSDLVWLCFLPLRMACPRKSHFTGHHSIQLDSVEGPSLPRGIPAPGGSRTCLALPASLHGSRIPYQNRLHDFLARFVPSIIRSPRTSVSSLQSRFHW